MARTEPTLRRIDTVGGQNYRWTKLAMDNTVGGQIFPSFDASQALSASVLSAG
jgi:hypothetical protein